jgi:hypothetical protein
MKRRKQNEPESGDLLSAARLPGAVKAAEAGNSPGRSVVGDSGNSSLRSNADNSSRPEIVEYVPLGATERWRVEKFQLFAAEFSVDQPWERNLVQFHELVCPYPRQWMIARRLFGISPVLLPDEALPGDYEPLSREGVCALLGLEPEHLRAELDAIRAMWLSVAPAPEPTVENAPPANPPEALQFGEEVLREFGFADSLFVVRYWDEKKKQEITRPQEDNRHEKEWFSKQVSEWRKMLSEPMAGTIARKALMNNLYLRRMEQAMASLSPESPSFDKLSKTKDELENRYQQQVEELQKMFPEMGIAGRVSFRAVISELIMGYREYKARKDTRLIDKIRTAAEVEVELRQSLQAPTARYRLGQTLYLIEAMHNLSDPDYRTQLRPATLKKLDAGFCEAVERLRQVSNEPLVDLEKGVMPGEGDEYPDLMEVEA